MNDEPGPEGHKYRNTFTENVGEAIRSPFYWTRCICSLAGGTGPALSSGVDLS